LVAKRQPVRTGARSVRQRAAQLVAAVLAVLVVLTAWAPTATAAPFFRQTQNGVNRLAADTLTSPGVPVPLRLSAAAGMTSLSWSASRSYASYRLERATSPAGPFTQIALLSPGPAGFTEFPLPANTGPYGIANGADGALWFTARDSNQIGRITTSGTITWYTVPTANSQPETIVSGPDGALWFTETAGNKIGRIAVDGTFSEYAVPSAASVPKGITTGADGNLYFTEQATGKVARITPGGVITEFPTLPAGASAPNAVAWGPDQNLWLTNGGTEGLTRVTPAGAATGFPTPTPSSGPAGIAVGPMGNLWFAEATGNKIGRFAPYYDSFAVTEVALTAGRSPFGITAGADGDMWFTERDGNRLGKITSTGVVTEYAVPTANSAPTSIAAGRDGALWFTQPGANKIGRYGLGLTTSFTDTTAIAGQHYFYRAYAVHESWTSAQAGTAMSLSMAPTSGTDATAGTGVSTGLTGADLAALGRGDNATYTSRNHWLTSAQTSKALRGLDSRDPDLVWAVGDTGTIMVSTDGGMMWRQSTSGTTQHLRAVRFVDSNTGWAVGDGGTILTTTDGGITWTAQASGTSANLRDVTFLDAMTGWAVGDSGTIRYWNGLTWSGQSPPSSFNMEGISAVSGSQVWAVGDGGNIIRYNGLTWSAVTSPATKHLKDVDGLDATHAWAVGDDGTILAYDGSTWTSKTAGTAKNLRSVEAIGASAVWAAGDSGTLRYFDGSSWLTRTSATGDRIEEISFANASEGHYTADNGSHGSTADGGTTWVAFPVPKTLQVTFPPAAVPTGASADRIRATFVYKTSSTPAADAKFEVRASFDGGASWRGAKTLTRPTSTATVTQTVDLDAGRRDPDLQTYGVVLRIEVTASNSFTTIHDMVRVDIN
jgi:virginiamycin B lyase